MPDVIEILKRVGAIVNDGHFVGASGRHLRTYINKDKLFPHTEEASKIGQLMAEKNLHLDIEAVVAPALGGIILSQWTAYHLSQMQGRKVLVVLPLESYAEAECPMCALGMPVDTNLGHGQKYLTKIRKKNQTS